MKFVWSITVQYNLQCNRSEQLIPCTFLRLQTRLWMWSENPAWLCSKWNVCKRHSIFKYWLFLCIGATRVRVAYFYQLSIHWRVRPFWTMSNQFWVSTWYLISWLAWGGHIWSISSLYLFPFRLVTSGDAAHIWKWSLHDGLIPYINSQTNLETLTSQGPKGEDRVMGTNTWRLMLSRWDITRRCTPTSQTEDSGPPVLCANCPACIRRIPEPLSRTCL